ncbi:LAQU0S06e04852g1_1 [Lachancea quebecensis]|uniref:LAQU0S06e04852g1_1 n=1 Tax=Lachancea quebecensis TaxID=1654605 RepID=A0A0N7MLM9_9SACH|nr:LAQU0S06e04852g1_1 [Lachancea quebecensis]
MVSCRLVIPEVRGCKPRSVPNSARFAVVPAVMCSCRTPGGAVSAHCVGVDRGHLRGSSRASPTRYPPAVYPLNIDCTRVPEHAPRALLPDPAGHCFSEAVPIDQQQSRCDFMRVIAGLQLLQQQILALSCHRPSSINTRCSPGKTPLRSLGGERRIHVSQ